MENYTQYEEYTLPSEGRIYEETVNPTVKLRSMTANEEMRRLAKTDRPYKVYADLIDACIVDPIGISSYDLCIGDFEFLMHKLRIVTYGPEYELRVTCPRCFDVKDEIINLDEFSSKCDMDIITENIEFDLPKSKHHIRLKMQTPRMLDSAKIENNNFRKSLRDKSVGDTDLIFTVKGLLSQIDGDKLDPITGIDWIRNLPMMDITYILQKSQKLNNAIGLDTELAITCEECGLDYKSPFRITTDFFNPRIIN